MDEPSQQVDPGITRRAVLKRVTAGVAIAWSAPVLLSVQNRASPAGTARASEGGD